METMATIEGAPIGRCRPDGVWEIFGYASELPCADCGTVTKVAAMLCDRNARTYHCTECDGAGYLNRRGWRRKAVA
jgi:hypothetical protein